MPAFIMGGNVMGTALVMEHANALAQMIVSEKDKLFDESHQHDSFIPL